MAPTSSSSSSSAARVPLQRQAVPHTRRSTGNSSTTDRRRQLLRSSAAASTTASSSKLDLQTYEGAIYYATMGVGGTSYLVIVDTGSSDLWISCSYLDSSLCQSSCPSSAYVISYGSGDVCVTTEEATVTFGSLDVADYGVGIAIGPDTQEGSTTLLLGDAKGLLGLAYPSLATYSSPAGYLIDYLDRFSVYLAPDDSDAESFLLLNSVDESFITKNSLTGYSVALKSESHWTLGMTSFQIGTTSDPISPCTSPTDGSCDVIVDTGTTLLNVPQQVYNTLAKDYWVPAGCAESEQESIEGMYVCASSASIPTLRFTFDEMNFFLDMESYITREGDEFLIDIQASSSGELSQTWILGGIFLKQFYTSYEVNKAVVFYCKEGSTCNQDGTSASADSNITSSDNTANTNGSSSNVSSTSSGSSDHHTLIVALIAALACVIIVALVGVCAQRYYRKRRARQYEYEQTQAQGYEMQTVGFTRDYGSGMYVSAAPLTPPAATARR